MAIESKNYNEARGVEEEPSKLYKVIHTEKEIKQRVRDIAEQVIEFAQPNDVFVCLLRGGLFFYADLMKAMCLLEFEGVKLHFLNVHTSKNASGSHVDVFDGIFDGNVIGQIQDGANVWIVDEIMDSGRSVAAVIDWFSAACRQSAIPAPEFNTVMMVERAGASHDPRVNHEIVGFVENHKEWFVGYGMDGSDGKLRAMPMIAIEMPDTENSDDSGC